eukprot:m.176110 g.176110  ORF g.176110 m.176110 type:complete len:817 (+) comp9956_c0_seq3:6-2456(+)
MAWAQTAVLALLLACARAAAPLGPVAGYIFPLSNLQLGLRHCNYVCSATPKEPGVQDFGWVIVPALSGAPDPAVSFQSVNYPTYYLTIADQATGAVGIAENPDKYDASWTLATPLYKPLSNLSYSIRSASTGAFAGKYITASNQNKAPCGYAPPSGDALLTDGSAAAASTWNLGTGPSNGTSVIVDVGTVINPAVNRKFMGCHHDYGFAQAPRGFTSNLIYGSSFEKGTFSVPSWTNYQSPGAHGGSGIGADTAFSSKPSMNVHVDSGSTDEVGVINRGLGGSGFALEGGKDYSVELYAYGDEDSTMFVELYDRTSGKSLARQTFPVAAQGPAWGSNWNNYSVTLTPSDSTTCEAIAWGSDPSIDCGGDEGDAYLCPRCGGEFRIGVVGKGSVNIGFVNLQPGSWGLLARKDGSYTRTLKSGADLLTTMGVSIIRSGGTVSQSMRWTDWRGPVWNRPSQQQFWGDSLLSGWGPFEVIDMCNALGIEPIITLAYDSNDVLDWANLVEYCWGDAETTSWGQRRAADGHPDVYNITVFELGNEQYNPHFLEQVAAMEKRAKAVGAPELHYMFPDNGGLNAADAAKAMAMGLPITRIMPDIHVGAGGAVQEAAGLFANPPVPGFDQSAINCETNAGTHDLQRALDEATDLITWFTYDTAVTNRLYARTASFCTGSGSQFDSWNQGIAFFLQNMTWFQPPGYVHQMITSTWAEKSVQATFASPDTIPLAAQLTADGKSLVIRAVNHEAVSQPLSVSLTGASLSGGSFTIWTLSGQSPATDNSPDSPTRIAPVKTTGTIAQAGKLQVTLPKYSFTILVASLQ